MPEFKKTFTKGRMNKDVDDRLVPQGEYIDATNLRISGSLQDDGVLTSLKGNSFLTDGTTGGFDIMGNKKRWHTFGNIPTDSPGLAATVLGDSKTEVVGSIKDTVNNKIYYFVHGFNELQKERPTSPQEVFQNFPSGPTNVGFESDAIIEYNIDTGNQKIVFHDIHKIVLRAVPITSSETSNDDVFVAQAPIGYLSEWSPNSSSSYK